MAEIRKSALSGRRQVDRQKGHGHHRLLAGQGIQVEHHGLVGRHGVGVEGPPGEGLVRALNRGARAASTGSRRPSSRACLTVNAAGASCQSWMWTTRSLR